MECLQLSFADLDRIKNDFKSSMNGFIKQNVQQTLNILCQLIHMIENFEKSKTKVQNFVSSYSESKIAARQRADDKVRRFLKKNWHKEMKNVEFTESDEETRKEEAAD